MSGPDFTRDLTLAAADVAARAELFAYLHWKNDPMTPESRAFIAGPAPRPWRGLLSPVDLHLIVVLEDAGHYEPPVAAIAAEVRA